MKYCLLLLTSLMGFSCLFAQNLELNGTVKDADGVGVIGAKVFIKEKTDVITLTDFDGAYKLQVLDVPVPFTLVVRYNGFADWEKVISSSGTYDATIVMDVLSLSDIVVTGVINPKSKLSSSVSLTTLNPEGIAQSAPRTTAEIFRTIPGIRAESSGGDGNTNIAVRGVPLSSGGSKYLQLQEDGLPIMLFGDMAFATSDIFLRADANLARIEAIRGGSASTLSSNSPAGIINFISNTGSTKEGTMAQTVGVDFNSFRTDFGYGAPIGNGLRFFVGGFVRTGEGPRNVGYTANQGGQFKANLTKSFDKGYARVYYKYLNDRTAAYMPMPIQVSGTNANPTWESIDGFNANQDGLQSAFLQSNFGMGSDGNRRRVDVADGMHPVSNAFGGEFSFNLGNDWTITSKNRYATNRGRFVAPFTAAVGSTGDMLNTIGGAIKRDLTGASLTYAHDGSPFTGGLAQVIHMFDTELENFDNIFSDSKLSKSFLNKKITASAGLFKGYQRVNMSWNWNSYMMEVKGDNAAMIDITMADSTQLSDNGQFAYGVPLWGCCQQQYNTTYDVTAPYAAVEFDIVQNLSVDASFRYDMGHVTGSGSGFNRATIDVNNDGIIQAIEDTVAVIDASQVGIVNYKYKYGSYSIGANYMLNENQAIFGRYSSGASAKADRIISPGTTTLFVGNPKDVINQAELGWKQKFKRGGLFVTGFYAATTEEGGYEASTQKVIENDYQAFGLELEGAYNFKGFDVRGAVTYTNAEITSGDNKGNAPRRQPALMYNVIPSFKYKAHAIGVSIIGQSSAYAQDNNSLIMPGYFITNAFINFGITKGLSLSLNANNLLNTIGITESEEGSITEGQVNYVRARSITGRSVSCTLRYNF